MTHTMSQRPPRTFYYNGRLVEEDNIDGFRQHSGPHGINISIERSRPSDDPEVIIDREYYGPHLSRGRARIPIPVGYRHPPPAFNIEPVPVYRAPRTPINNRHRSPSPPRGRRLSFVEEDLITVLLPGGDRAVVDRGLLNRHLPRAQGFLRGRLLDVEGFLRDEYHGDEDERQHPALTLELDEVARHVFFFFTELAPSGFLDTFDDWRVMMHSGGPQHVLLAARRAYAMCCLFDQHRALGCSHAVGRHLLAVMYQLIDAVGEVQPPLVPILFRGATRVLAEGRGVEEQEDILWQMYRLIQEGDPEMAEGLMRSFHAGGMNARTEGARARRVWTMLQKRCGDRSLWR